MYDFPTVVDSSLISQFRTCPQLFFRASMEHWKGKGPSPHLHAGGAFARGLEVTRQQFFEEGKPSEESIALGMQALTLFWGDYEPPEGIAKTLTRMLGALEFYFDCWPLGEGAIPTKLPSGKRAIEFSFAEPTDFINPQTGDPVIYCGRTDQIVDFAEGVYLEDDKTTSSLGASWSRKWDLRSQFTGYTWGATKAGISTAGILVRGVSILKTKYDKAEALTFRAQFEVDRWYQQLMRDLDNMATMWEHSIAVSVTNGEEHMVGASAWDYNLDESCTAYGGCQFLSVCKSPEPEDWLPMYFERRRWDPLTRTETLLA